jgi:molybdopterin-guanine dinucleotide biosynthesis protein A
MRPAAVILAGGRSSRMGGGDKCLLHLDNKPLLAHIAAALEHQTQGMLINSNSDPGLFSRFGLPVLSDAVPGFQGPLAGLLTGMLWSRRLYPNDAYLLSVAGDMPFLPPDLVTRLHGALRDGRADIAIAACPQGSHPVIGLWPVDLAERLEHDLMETNIRSVMAWLGNFRVARAMFSSRALLNINTPGELEACRKIAA